MSLVKSVNLKRPPDSLAARGWFPGLIRKLLVATLPSDASIYVPAFEQVSRPGFDGKVDSPIESKYVPKGQSVWELGTNDDPQAKANGDYEKRTKDTRPKDRLNAIYVSVSSQEWQKKDDWAAEKSKGKNGKRSSHWIVTTLNIGFINIHTLTCGWQICCAYRVVDWSN